MRFRGPYRRARRPGLQMTPMIDIVFLLLVFFIMTFQIVATEGDFRVAMAAAQRAGDPPPTVDLPVRLRLTATADGGLASIRLGDRVVADHAELRQHVRELVQSAGGVETRLKIDLVCDHHLNYEHVIDAVTACRGYLDQQGRLVDLIRQIRFVPR